MAHAHVEMIIKASEFIDDIYFVRGKGRGREGLSSIKERILRGRLKVRRGSQEQPWRWKFMSSTLVPPSSLISSSSNNITQICLITTSTKS